MKFNLLISRLFLVLALVAMPLQGAFAMASDQMAGSHVQMSSEEDCHHTADNDVPHPGDQVSHSVHCGVAGHCCAVVDLATLWMGEVQKSHLNVIPEHKLLPVVLSLETKPPRIL